MTRLVPIFVGFLLDCLFGDPHWVPHPVRWMGSAISGLEQPLRRWFPKTPKGERAAGAVLWVVVAGGSVLISWGILALAALVSPYLRLVVESVMCYQVLAAKGLMVESMRVYPFLCAGDLPGARQAVSMIVGRDTQQLTDKQVAKAAVETVAENTSDGVIAPLFYLFLGALFGFAAPLAMGYKAVNTMDSMVGYKNDRYMNFGRIPAKLDDLFNLLPSRLSGLLMVAAAFPAGLQGKNAWRIFRRDRRNHASPNSAQTEAACAGALGVQLAGDASYFGKVVHKPTIGDPLREVEYQDIPRANRLMYVTTLLALALFTLLEMGLLWLTRG